MTKGEKVKLAISLGVEVETAIALFDQIEELDGGAQISAARKARNERYYEKNGDTLRQKARERKESLRRLKNPVSDEFKTIQSVQDAKTGRWIVRKGTVEHDAWNAHERKTKGRDLPYSKGIDGWSVPTRLPPSYAEACA